MFRIFRRGSLALILLATLSTACDTTGSTGAEPEPAVEASTGAPAAESTGHEEPAPAGGDKPAVEMVGMPAGADDAEANDDGSVCIDVRWLGGDDARLGEGVRFEVAEIRLVGADRSGFSCGDDPCDGFTFDSDTDNCLIAVQPGDSEGALSLYGRLRCSTSPGECERFRSDLQPAPIAIPAAENGTENGEENGGEETAGSTE